MVMCASKPGPAMPRGIGRSGIGACIIVSHLRHEQAGRTWRTTSKRPGMYSSTSVTLLRKSEPPQVLQTLVGGCTTSRRGSSGGSVRRLFFSGTGVAASVPGGASGAVSGSLAGAAVSALAASASSSANSS